MYKLNYWSYSPTVLCYFDDYDECKKAFDLLKSKYPDSKIWMDKVTTVSFNEFMDNTDGKTKEYES